ncbi:MAG: Bax protein [Candidatus Azotimanducaceae bacterium]|jgi:Bax protein
MARAAKLAVLAISVTLAHYGCSDSTPIESVASAEEVELSLPKWISPEPKPIPKFGDIANVSEKKTKFFIYLQKRIEATNDHVWAERNFVLHYREKVSSGSVQESERKQFDQLVKRYGFEESSIEDEDQFNLLLTRVDVVPASLVLAQAANESAWGTSRFATEGKNLFGIWCYREGCGIKPKRRNSGSSHEVRKFKTVQDGVRFYVHNINIGHAYDSLRTLRAELRSDSERLSGVKLATGLTRYSERGLAYVEEIQNMITHNELHVYNKVRSL